MRQNATAVRLFLESPAFNPAGLNYTTCPECGHEGKLMVGLHDDGCAWYKCLRARCQLSGVVGKGHVRKPTEKRVKPPAPLPECVCTLSVYEDLRADLAEASVFADMAWLGTFCAGWNQRTGRYVYPIHDAQGTRTGTVLRAYYKTPKVLTHRHVRDVPLLAWYNQRALTTGRAIVVVEDQVSAARLGGELVSVALLGTHLSAEGADTINAANSARLPVYVALDADATDKAAAIRAKLRSASVLPLGKDIKNMARSYFHVWRRSYFEGQA